MKISFCQWIRDLEGATGTADLDRKTGLGLRKRDEYKDLCSVDDDRLRAEFNSAADVVPDIQIDPKAITPNKRNNRREEVRTAMT